MFVDLKILEEYVEKGLLRKAEDEDLVQYNYTDYCNNNDCWDDVTLFNRGNIYEKSTGKLIAKAMPKFFNYSQLSEEEQKHFSKSMSFSTTEKMDGCLGILYKYKGKIRCNSRGGFDNYVTDSIKRILPKYELEALSDILDTNTLNVEVVSPETHIICNYGNERNLYLITAFCDLGNYWQERSINAIDLFSNIINMPRPSYNIMSWEELFTWQKTSTYEKEGFVVTLNSSKFGVFERVKLKSDDYLKIAKIKTGLSKRSIWKIMRNDIENNTQTIRDYLTNNIPDEIILEATKYYEDIKEEMNKVKENIMEVYKNTLLIPIEELSSYFKENPFKYCSGVYSLRRNKPFDKLLIKAVEPKIEDDV